MLGATNSLLGQVIDNNIEDFRILLVILVLALVVGIFCWLQHKCGDIWDGFY